MLIHQFYSAFQKEFISKTPIPLEVDGCPYWIGTYPLNWLDARGACLAINASLVIFDSTEIINHMMNLMTDYNHREFSRNL